MHIKDSKKEFFRKESIQQLKKLKGTGSYKRDKKVISRLYDEIKKSNAKNIMIYIPLKIEIDISYLIKKLRKEKKVLFVPFMEGKSFRLVKYRLPLKIKKFGIKEPNDSKQYRIKNLDLAIVPMVGTDITLRRVGFGKGMYDRFFEKENKNIKQTIFVSRGLCYSKSMVTDDHDIKADKIITPLQEI